ncbi:divergent polysaccharide deacetylase [Fontibacillus phaseoli]|uniref:Divergent polysaccharide deacetylase n=1 Tax=Fontibacillus phaseoli TaxID=1416533 RepID=A0A369BLQ2_9BACL|nr:divergent polysaccharide deacetylase [Fontibacillus phaseoli]
MRCIKKKARSLACLLLGSLLLNPAAGSAAAEAAPVLTPIPQEDQAQDKQAAESQQRLAIIIDDLGNSMGGTAEILQMPVKLTVAVMPFLPTTEEDAKKAHE